MSPKPSRRASPPKQARLRAQLNDPKVWVGIDGEGIGRSPHLYTLLSAVDATGEVVGECANWDKGLNTETVFETLLNLPSDRRYWGFALGYDITKWLTDLPPKLIYQLARPDTRRIDNCPIPYAIHWNGFKINWNLAHFTLADDADWVEVEESAEYEAALEAGDDEAASRAFAAMARAQQQKTPSRPGGRKFECWDIFKFFGCRFTKALETWKVPVDLDKMNAMKAARSEFTRKSRKPITEYCRSECQAGGELARRLLAAHDAAGIELKAYFGAGSTAGALLSRWGIKEKRGEQPEPVQLAVASAFFGGRFENSVVGRINGPIYSFDISSAYPYQCTRLPCLEHGTWRHIRKRAELEGCETAVVRYRLHKRSDVSAWGPFPFRLKDGSIVYPGSSGGGWVWQDEFLAGERIFAGVEFKEAWVWVQNCDCKPFAEIPRIYRERVKLGKDGAGIVFKLGPNAVYGKLAQSKGENPPYQSWVWAGLITSNTRAQILDVLASCKHHSSLLMVATDGVYLTEDPPMARPSDTGTFDLPKPLGGWERKVYGDMFAARPGVYFPARPTKDDIDSLRARGIGKSVLFERYQTLIDAWERGDTSCEFPPVERFKGAVTGTRVRSESEYVRDDNYGEWIQHPVTLSFSGLPKREQFAQNGKLTLRFFGLTETSLPYTRALELNEEHAALELSKLIESEQPDGEW